MKKISILGAGESGIGAALLARQRGYEVFVSDGNGISTSRKQVLKENQVEFEEGRHTLGRILTGTEVIKSPGISFSHEIVKQVVAAGIPVIDELEFASRYSKGKAIAITGTNGKTTTSLLIYHFLQKAGMDVGLAGNVGKSWAAQLTEKDHGYWVLEVSSFQIDGFDTFKPHVAIVINITPDHLDRYDYSLDNYIQSKINLLKKMDEKDHLIYFREDKNIQNGLRREKILSQVYEVSLKEMPEKGGFFNQNAITVETGQGHFTVSKEEISLTGDHNMINVMCALNAALVVGADGTRLREGLKDFENVAHRMERVEVIDGMVYINDSKATNVDAAAYALAAYREPLIWIAGGVDKGNDYSLLYPWVQDHVKMLICLGKDNAKLKAAFGKRIAKIVETQEVAEAVKLAQEHGSPGDVVLLSPACASFDLFKNYEDRGDQFKEAVRQLKTGRR